MSINNVLGNNLAKLCESRASIAQVARDLDISRVQLYRYIKGTSFPKPGELETICRYFDVDARIFTTAFSAEELDQLSSFNATRLAQRHGRFRLDPAFHTAVKFACSDKDFYNPTLPLEDGLHFIWRRSFSSPEQFFRDPLQVSHIGKACVGRGLEFPPAYGSADMRPTPKEREFRALIHQVGSDVTMTLYGPSPGNLVSYLFVSPLHENKNILAGITMVGRPALPGRIRTSTCLLIKAKTDFKSLLDIARSPYFFDPEDVPPFILSTLEAIEA